MAEQCGWVSPRGRCTADPVADGMHCRRHACERPGCWEGKPSATPLCDACAAAAGEAELTLAAVVEAARQDPALSEAERAAVCALIPRLQGSLDSLRDVCIEVFVVHRRFRKENELTRKNVGQQRVSGGQIKREWRSAEGQLPDGRSIESAFHAAKLVAREMLEALDSASERTWAKLLADHAATSNPKPVTAIPNVAAGPDVRQPIPDPRFYDEAFLNQLVGCADLAESVLLVLEQHRADIEADVYGTGWRPIRQANAHGHDKFDAAIADASESDHDLYGSWASLGALFERGETVQGRSLYNEYLKARARAANLTFADLVRGAIDMRLGSFAAGVGVGDVEVQAGPVKGDARFDAKKGEYARKRLPNPLASHVKDLVRLTVCVATIGLVIAVFFALDSVLMVVEVKNRLGTDAGTHDVLVVVRLDDGFLAEIQIHMVRVQAIKHYTHKPYKVDRLLPTECPCPQGLVKFSPWHAEKLTAARIKLVATYC